MVEPLTALTMVVAKYGVDQVVAALTGDKDFATLAAEVVGALSASEGRISERLAGIENRLEEVLEQRYATAIGAGLRTLADAGTARNSSVRREELKAARDLFREAVAAARSRLQTAVAERYLVLCAICLGREDAARTALARLNAAVTETVLEAEQIGTTSTILAAKKVPAAGRLGTAARQREFRITNEALNIIEAVVDIVGFARLLLIEAKVLAQMLGEAPPPRIESRHGAHRKTPEGFNNFFGRWHVRQNGREPARIGALSVVWNRITINPPGGGGDRGVALHRTISAEVTVRADPVLIMPASVQLDVFGGAITHWETGSSSAITRTLETDQSELSIRQSLDTTEALTMEKLRENCRVTIGGVLVFQP